MVVTGPYFYYSNQIYPEFPAIAIVLTTLIALDSLADSLAARTDLWDAGRFRCWGMLTVLL